jgi:hypothetical protein
MSDNPNFEGWTIQDLLDRCTDYDDMSLEMNRAEFKKLRELIATFTPPAASRVPDFEHMLKRWLSYGRACLEAGEKLPRHLVSETEALLAAPSKEDAK